MLKEPACLKKVEIPNAVLMQHSWLLKNVVNVVWQLAIGTMQTEYGIHSAKPICSNVESSSSPSVVHTRDSAHMEWQRWDFKNASKLKPTLQ